MEPSQPASYGPYRVVRKIGSGGMGVVYEARHDKLGKRVAIKTISATAQLTNDAKARFMREAQAAAKIRHPNVAQVFDIGVQDGAPYMVLELLVGQDLASLLEKEQRLTATQAADLLIPVIAGLAAAHDCGIVHRDLKPQNLFISEERGSLVPRVLDFGVSKVLSDEAPPLTRSDVVLGTAHYMSPEQARGVKSLDARSDQYSLGNVLYECVTGQLAFEADSVYAMIRRIVEGDFTPPSEVQPDLAPELEAVILKAMSLKPHDRYPSTASLGQALLPFASEKVRLLYADELSAAAEALPEFRAARVPGRSSGQSGSQLALSSTIIESAPGSEKKPRATGSRRIGVVVALATVGGAALGYVLSSETKPGSALFPNGNASTHASTFSGAASSPGTEPGHNAVPADNAVPPPVADPAPSAMRADVVVHRRIDSTPKGATVWRDGAQLGVTPYEVQLGQRDIAELVLRAPGYAEARIVVSAQSDRSAQVNLLPASAPTPKATQTVRPPSSANVNSKPSTTKHAPNRAAERGLVQDIPF